jgi:hypothetical protein
LTLPNLEKIASVYDIDYQCIHRLGNSKVIIDYCMGNEPIISEVFADPNQQFRHRVKSKLVDGKMVTAPMNEVD